MREMMFERAQTSRRKGTAVGASLAAVGLTCMFSSPFLALRLSAVTGILIYHVVFLAGFICLLYGVGYVLLANNLWGN